MFHFSKCGLDVGSRNRCRAEARCYLLCNCLTGTFCICSDNKLGAVPVNEGLEEVWFVTFYRMIP